MPKGKKKTRLDPSGSGDHGTSMSFKEYRNILLPLHAKLVKLQE